jgi:hypothetical protein
VSKKILFSTLFILIAVFAVADEEVAITNSSFENGTPEEVPTGWEILSGEGHIALCTGNLHSGNSSMELKNLEGSSITVASAPVNLTVGHLYKLSGWVKTKDVSSDPTARYPVALPATMSMISFPFTENGPASGSTRDWHYVEVQFLATKSKDRVQLHLGRNGWAKGVVWFDDLKLEKVEDIEEFLPMDTVRWFGPAYRYDEKGWIVVHIEGEPYERGYQYGFLVGSEITQYMDKLSYRQNETDPSKGWRDMRFMADSLLLRGFDEEYLIEMRGIADGANHAGIKYHGRDLDLIDIVTVNSAIDLGQMSGAMRTTPTALSGRNFLREEDELLLSDDYNKCSSFVATGENTDDGRIVFGQMFMWNGYTGVHWNVLIDIDPSEGNRFVMHSFPGGIHSGADFYMNEAGIVIGETTVSQTPFDINGTPQSNRIRKAIQYANNFEEVEEILFTKNNGMYTNDWTLADAKTDEGGTLLLGTKTKKLWRTGSPGHPADTPADHKDFIWANNNNRDPEVRKEYIPNANNAPYDLIFRPANRDVAFQGMFEKYKGGKFNATAAVDIFATSPINRAHACDSKITTGEMIDQLAFIAHFGKTTLREKWVGERYIADLPGATPHMTLGYTSISPIFITDKLQAARAKQTKATTGGRSPHRAKTDLSKIEANISFDTQKLWQNTVYPAGEEFNWFISSTAAYWNILKGMPTDLAKANSYQAKQFIELNNRYLYTVSRDGELAPNKATRVYDRYNHYYMPRIKGTFLLHQLRLRLGNDKFAELMNTVHDTFANKEMSTADFVKAANKVSGKDMESFISQWLEREGLPDPVVVMTTNGNKLTVSLEQEDLYDFHSSVVVKTAKSTTYYPIAVAGAATQITLELDAPAISATFNPGVDIPTPRDNFYTFANFVDDFHNTVIIHGTKRQLEANYSLAYDFNDTLADGYVELLMPLKKDAEVSEEELANMDLILLGGPDDNAITARLAAEGLLPDLKFQKNMFTWRGMGFNDIDDGMIIVMPNPYNKDKVLYLFLANSQQQMYDMTKKYNRGLNQWVMFNGDEIFANSYDGVEAFDFKF